MPLNDKDCKDMIARLQNKRGNDNCCKHVNLIIADANGRCSIAEEIVERDSKNGTAVKHFSV